VKLEEVFEEEEEEEDEEEDDDDDEAYEAIRRSELPKTLEFAFGIEDHAPIYQHYHKHLQQ
jgi:hypothetical protein